MKDKAKATTVAKVFREALEATVALEAVAVFREVKAVTDMSHYLHVRRSVISITS
jgi:hypothetical protein